MVLLEVLFSLVHIEWNFHICLVVLLQAVKKTYKYVLFGIEYKTDFFTETLLIPVPREIANNMLSLIERSGSQTPEFSIESPLESPLGEILYEVFSGLGSTKLWRL